MCVTIVDEMGLNVKGAGIGTTTMVEVEGAELILVVEVELTDRTVTVMVLIDIEDDGWLALIVREMGIPPGVVCGSETACEEVVLILMGANSVTVAMVVVSIVEIDMEGEEVIIEDGKIEVEEILLGAEEVAAVVEAEDEDEAAGSSGGTILKHFQLCARFPKFMSLRLL